LGGADRRFTVSMYGIKYGAIVYHQESSGECPYLVGVIKLTSAMAGR
jgi:hypothetical protein